MIQKDGVDIEMLPDDWKRTWHVIQACDFFVGKVFLVQNKKGDELALITALNDAYSQFHTQNRPWLIRMHRYFTVKFSYSKREREMEWFF